MRTIWKSPRVVDRLTTAGELLVIPDGNELVAIDREGNERWTRACESFPSELVGFSQRIAIKEAPRRAPPIVVAFDLAGEQSWTYAREWSIGSDGLVGDDEGLVVSGTDFGTDGARWVFLTEAGEVAADVASPTGEAARLAGAWLYTSGPERTSIVRTDRRGANPTTISRFAHITTAASRDHVVAASESEGSIIELATGREVMRVDVARTFHIGIHGERGAWVDAARRPVLYDLATGAQLWQGEPLGELPRDYLHYDCYLGATALVCYGEDEVAFYDLKARAPVATTASTQRGRFWGDRFVELADDGVVCWQVP